MASHTGFIVAAFGVTGLALAGTIAAILLDYRAQLRALARLSGLEALQRPADRARAEDRT
jgi:heme exporter protein CcmD